MGDLRARLRTALDGPDAESVFECAHCGASHDNWRNDCAECGGVLTRIVTEVRDDECSTLG